MKIPDLQDIDRLFAFARAAGVKVIYSVRLQKNTPEEAAKITKYVTEKYEIGRASCRERVYA